MAISHDDPLLITLSVRFGLPLNKYQLLRNKEGATAIMSWLCISHTVHTGIVGGNHKRTVQSAAVLKGSQHFWSSDSQWAEFWI